MSKARLVITAVTVQNRSVAQVAADYGVARSWIYELLARYRAEGEAAFQPRSRRPVSNPNATSPARAQLIATIRAQLSSQGLDAGAESIRWHLSQTHRIEISRATIHRILVREGLVVPTPKKRPKSSYVRFAAELPNQCWQADFTHYRLADGTEVEILCWIDDCTRYAISLTAHVRVSTPAVIAAFRAACDQHGRPASTLTDNGMVFTTRFSGHPGRNGFEALLATWHITQINGRGGHPQTQGKVERFQQTLKRWLRAQPDQPATLTDLQALLDRFAQIYNHERGHRSLPNPGRPGRPLRHPAQEHTRHQPARHQPRTRPRRCRRHRRHRHPARERPPAPHRHRPNPQPNPRPDPGPRPPRPRHQRHHRRDPARAHHRARPRLPATTPKMTNTRTHSPWVRASGMS